MRPRRRRVFIWGWFAVAAVVIALQQFGWARVGRIVRTWTQAVLDAAWPVLMLVWPLVLAAGAAGLSATQDRWWPNVARWLRGLSPRRWLRLFVGAIGVVVLLVFAVAILPPLLVDQAVFHNPADAFKARNDVRTTLLQALAGVFFALGLVLTWRQLRVNQEGQITERFTRAVDQIGAKQVDVRLGGIYALERIARDSPGDQAAVAEILTAYVRHRSPWPPTQTRQPGVDVPLDQVAELGKWAPDVQAAMAVLGRVPFLRLALAVL
jgi:hypothetical protein